MSNIVVEKDFVCSREFKVVMGKSGVVPSFSPLRYSIILNDASFFDIYGEDHLKELIDVLTAALNTGEYIKGDGK